MGKGGQPTYRQRGRHRHLRRMAAGSMLGLFPVVIIVLVLWWDVHNTGYIMSEEYMEKQFCEMVERVVPQVEAYRSEHGHLPDTLSVEGLVNDWGNMYIDTTGREYVGFIYHHDDSTYALVHRNSRAEYVSAPMFEGYLFYHWDEEGDSMMVDTVFRQ